MCAACLTCGVLPPVTQFCLAADLSHVTVQRTRPRYRIADDWLSMLRYSDFLKSAYGSATSLCMTSLFCDPKVEHDRTSVERSQTVAPTSQPSTDQSRLEDRLECVTWITLIGELRESKITIDPVMSDRLNDGLGARTRANAADVKAILIKCERIGDDEYGSYSAVPEGITAGHIITRDGSTFDFVLCQFGGTRGRISARQDSSRKIYFRLVGH